MVALCKADCELESVQTGGGIGRADGRPGRSRSGISRQPQRLQTQDAEVEHGRNPHSGTAGPKQQLRAAGSAEVQEGHRRERGEDHRDVRTRDEREHCFLKGGWACCGERFKHRDGTRRCLPLEHECHQRQANAAKQPGERQTGIFAKRQKL